MKFSRRDVLKVAGALPLAPLLSPGESSSGSARKGEVLKVQDFASIQAAVDAAMPGDVVEVPSGTYHEAITFPRSGTTEAPITLTAAAGAIVVIDGADRDLQAPGSSRWTRASGDLFTAAVPFDSASPVNALCTWISRHGTRGTNECDRLLATYASLAVLDGEAPRGEGSFRTGGAGEQVYVRLDGGADPNTVGLSVGRSHAVLNLGGQSHLRIKNVEIRNGGWAGIWTPPPSEGTHGDIVIENVTVRNCFWGITGTGLSGLTIRCVRILNGKVADWPRGGGYSRGVGAHPGSPSSDSLSPWRGFGIRYGDCSDVEVADSLIGGQWDGVKIAASQNVRVHHCTIRNIWDDGIELESASNTQRDIEVFNNHLYDTNIAFSVTSNGPGPVYIYRNVAECEHLRDGSRYNVKSGEDSAGLANNVKFYHNTFHSGGHARVAFGEYNVWEKLSDKAPNRWHGYEFVNNIFHRTPGESLVKPNWNFRGAGPGIPGDDNHWEANVYNVSTPEDQLGHNWDDSRLSNANAPWQAHDYDNRPGQISLLGSFGVPASGGADAGTEFSFSAAALALHLERLRAHGMGSATFILRDNTRQPAAVNLASKESDLAPTSLRIGLQGGGQVNLETPAADTYVVNSDANRPRGGETTIAVLNGSSSTSKQLGYIRFDLTDLPGPVDSATLTVRLASIEPGRTTSTINVYSLDPEFTPSPGAETSVLVLADLRQQFMNFDVENPSIPRDLRLVDSSPAKNSGSDYPAQQDWPDSITSYPSGRNRGAWEDGMGRQRIGASAYVLRRKGRR